MKFTAFITLEGIVVYAADAVNNTLGFIALLAAAVIGLGVIYQKVVRPIVRFGRRADEVMKILLILPDWVSGFERRFSAIEEVVHDSKPPPPRAQRGLKSL